MDSNIVLLLAPLVVIQLTLMIFCIRDLFRPDRQVKGDNKLIWLAVILLVNTIGPLIYLFAGREEA